MATLQVFIVHMATLQVFTAHMASTEQDFSSSVTWWKSFHGGRLLPCDAPQ